MVHIIDNQIELMFIYIWKKNQKHWGNMLITNIDFYITTDKLQAFIRYELPFEDLIPSDIPDVDDIIYDRY